MINQLTLVEIRALDAGSWFSPRFAGTRIPTLEEFLKSFGKKTHLVLEIKDEKATRETLLIVKNLRLLNNVIFTSFNLKIVEEIKDFEPRANIGFLTREVTREILKILKNLDIKQICPYAPLLSSSLVEKIRLFDISIRAWGVETEELMGKMLDLGVYSMTVNSPDKLIDLLKKRKIIENNLKNSVSNL